MSGISEWADRARKAQEAVNELGAGPPGKTVPCPPWCVTDHGKYNFHGSERITVYAPQFCSCHVRAIRYSALDHAEIQVAAAGMVSVRSDRAADLAAVIEQLADATPGQHRELAAAIRAAAAQITEGSNG
jgi:hypothetical protein